MAGVSPIAIPGISNITSIFGNGMVGLVLEIIIAAIVLLIVLGIFWWWYNSKKKWFLKVLVLIPRSDNRFMGAEFAKGTYNAKQGVVLIKRYKKKPVAMKPFDIKRFLQGDNILTVVQVGIEDFRPVLNDTYLEMIDDVTGQEGALIKAKIDTSESKSWKNSFERDTKSAFSFSSLLRDYFPYISMGIVIFMMFVGFAILYGKIKG